MSHERKETSSSMEHLTTAWQWVLRLREDSAGQDDLTAWLQWYEADEAHRVAFEEMQALWHGMGELTEGPQGLDLEQLLGSPVVVSASGRDELPADRSPALADNLAGNLARSVISWVAPALSLATVLGLSLWALLLDQSPQIPAASVEIHREVLPDGSQVELAAQSSIGVHYTDEQRTLELKQGEAYFTVAHNRERPFIVEVGDVRVRAVGTAFNVKRIEQRVVVTVSEGTVDIYSSGPARQGSRAVRVAAGRQATWVSNGSGPVMVDPIEIAHVLAWRQGRLEYVDQPLSLVISDVNRYSARQVVIADESVGRIVYSGTVFTGETEKWLAALPRVFPVEMALDESGRVLLTDRAAARDGI